MTYRDDYKDAAKDYFWTVSRAILAALVAILAIFLLLVVTTPLTIAFGWFQGEAELRSFNHVRETYREAYDDVNAMEANVHQACRIATAAKAETDPVAKQQRESQLIAIENNFDRIRGEYDAYMSDHFRGKIIRPGDLPMPYPTLEEREQAVCA